MRHVIAVFLLWTVSCLHHHAFAADDFPRLYNSEPASKGQPMAPEVAAGRMVVPEGFRTAVFASEPDVQNPIAMAWDSKGQMWVAENFTYAERQQRFDLSLRDRVVILHDQDGDGRAESRRVFSDSLRMLTSVQTGTGGVWLMCPPQLLFVPDANGDDVPDGPPQVMLDGFDVAEDNYHNFANGLKWGPDGWLYGRCGHSCPGRLGVPGTSDDRRIPIDGGIWRFHPERRRVEVLCHGTVNPWGHDWDVHGELFFINTVIGHLWHMLPGAHFKESFGESDNPGVYERMDTIADHYHFDTRGSWSESRDGKANGLGGGHAHIGMMIYKHSLWPEKYRNRLFTLNMHGQRANVERLERHGAGYVGRHEPDFMVAADPFFRGMEISVGPDGNVFVLDWSDTGECHEHTGVHRTSGRIFRIAYGGLPGPPKATSEIDSRRTQDQSLPAITTTAGATATSTAVPLAELWRRYREGETTAEQLRALLRDPDEYHRVWGIRLLTDFWPLDTIMGPLASFEYPSDTAAIAEFLRMSREDTSGPVLLTLASVLQRLPLEHRGELAKGLMSHRQFADDRDLPFLVWYGLIPVGNKDPQALADLAAHCHWPQVLKWMTRFVASRVDQEPGPLNTVLRAAVSLPATQQDSVLQGMQDAFRGWQKVIPPAAWAEFSAGDVAVRSPDRIRELSSLFGDGRALEEIRNLVLDGKAEMKVRQSALQTLIAARPPELRSLCESVLNVRILNATAASGLAMFDDKAIGQQLIQNYRRFRLEDRSVVMTILVSRPSFASALLEGLGSESAMISASDLTAFHARQIRSHGSEALNAKLAEVWGELRDSSTERRTIIDSLRKQLDATVLQSADLSAGRALFAKTCSQCHLLYGEGRRIGPDLTGSQRGNLEYLLENIMDPSAVVSRDYRMTVVVTKDGRVLNGLIVARDDRVLTLQTSTEQQILEIRNIEELRPTTLSSMPDGLLSTLTPEQIVNLMGYLMYRQQVPLPQ